MSATKLVILGQRFGQKLQHVYDTVVSESKYPINFRQDDHGQFEVGVQGEHTLNKNAGHLIRLRPGFGEFDVAHELCHALMSARGFPNTSPSGFSLHDNEICRLGAILKYALTHQTVNEYLKEFSYQKDVQFYYDVNKLGIQLHLDECTNSYSAGSLESLEDGLGILELLLAGELDDSLRDTLASKAAEPLTIATELAKCLKSCLVDTPEGFRKTHIMVIHWIDEYVRTRGTMKQGLAGEILTEPVLSESEINAKASQVFELEVKPFEVDRVALFIRYVPDHGYCYALAVKPDEVTKWQRRLSEMLVSEFVAFTESFEE